MHSQWNVNDPNPTTIFTILTETHITLRYKIVIV